MTLLTSDQLVMHHDGTLAGWKVPSRCLYYSGILLFIFGYRDRYGVTAGHPMQWTVSATRGPHACSWICFADKQLLSERGHICASAFPSYLLIFKIKKISFLTCSVLQHRKIYNITFWATLSKKWSIKIIYHHHCTQGHFSRDIYTLKVSIQAPVWWDYI